MSDAAILARLGALLPPARLRTDADTLASHGRDWTRLYQPDPLAVAFPESVAEVQALVAIANDTGCLIALGMRDGMSMLYLETCRSDSMVTVGPSSDWTTV